eukprot:4790362-Pleurochrysis_carterae.AAC.1
MQASSCRPMHLFSPASVASFSSNSSAMGSGQSFAQSLARRVVLLYPDAQLARNHAVEALDAALALAVASPP